MWRRVGFVTPPAVVDAGKVSSSLVVVVVVVVVLPLVAGAAGFFVGAPGSVPVYICAEVGHKVTCLPRCGGIAAVHTKKVSYRWLGFDIAL